MSEEIKVGDKVEYNGQILEIWRITVDAGLYLSNGQHVCRTKVRILKDAPIEPEEIWVNYNSIKQITPKRKAELERHCIFKALLPKFFSSEREAIEDKRIEAQKEVEKYRAQLKRAENRLKSFNKRYPKGESAGEQ